MAQQTLEEYLRSESGISPDFRVRALVAADGKITFIIHPFDRSGKALDFEVSGNTVKPFKCT